MNTVLSFRYPSSEEVDMLIKFFQTRVESFQKDYLIRRCFRVEHRNLEAAYIRECANCPTDELHEHQFPSFVGLDSIHLQSLSRMELSLSDSESIHSQTHCEYWENFKVQTEVTESLKDCIWLELQTRYEMLQEQMKSSELCQKKRKEEEEKEIFETNLPVLYLAVGVATKLVKSTNSTITRFLPKFLIEIETKKEVKLKFVHNWLNQTLQSSVQLCERAHSFV